MGTTIKSPEKLPRQLSVDKKHTRLLEKKAYIATMVGTLINFQIRRYRIFLFLFDGFTGLGGRKLYHNQPGRTANADDITLM